jgi:hypothetical protein
MPEKSTIVITNCTHRKRSLGAAICADRVLGGRIKKASLSAAVKCWLKSVSGGNATLPVEQTYGGRSFSEARWAAEYLNADLYVVSAGLGLLPPRTLIPHYNLTVAGGTGSIQELLTRNQATPSDWWRALTTASGNPNPIYKLIQSNRVERIFLALPAAYLDMLQHDLKKIGKDKARKLRILTSPLGSRTLPINLIDFVLPYDERLEGIYPGTRTDFPQRALRHFITTFPRELSHTEAKVRVLKVMKKSIKPAIPTRERKTDKEIISLIDTEWKRFNGSSTHLLRFLRDEALVACEQSRFRDLWRKVAEMKM